MAITKISKVERTAGIIEVSKDCELTDPNFYWDCNGQDAVPGTVWIIRDLRSEVQFMACRLV